MKRILKAIRIFLFLCLLVACDSLPSAIFQDESCSPPCWQQIIPGQSSLQDVNSRLMSISEINSKSIRTKSIFQSNDGLVFSFRPAFREDTGSIMSQAGIVEVIDFGIKQNSIKLGDIIQKWGPPNEYISLYYWYVEVPYLATSIIYTHEGIILETIRDMRANEVPLFDSGFPIQSVVFTNPSSTFTPLQNGYLGKLNSSDIRDGLQPWTGYGKINFLKYH